MNQNELDEALNNGVKEFFHLEGLNLSHRNLCNCRFIGLVNCTVTHSQLIGCWFANLSYTNLTYSKLLHCDLNYVKANGLISIGTDYTGSTLLRANLRGANLTRASLDYAELSLTDFLGANLTDTCLSREPNACVPGFEIDGDSVIGYRTRESTFSAPGYRYEDGREYVAPVFSASNNECHPGLYLQPRIERGYYEIIKVKSLIKDVHMAGSAWRTRKFTVIGAV